MRGEFPYKNIGERLRKWRLKVHESIDEVSGAVEIDRDHLQKIEKGLELPSEDILLLLISHLDVAEKDATQILEQVGYVRPQPDSPNISAMDEQIIKQTLMVIPVDNRILYSDSVNISATPNGVVFDFLQSTNNPQPATIGRIGMSLEHAARLQKLLDEILTKTDRPQKMIESSNDPKKTDKPSQS